MKLRTPMAMAGAAALAVTTGLVTTANPSQAAATTSYAYGFSAEGPFEQAPTPESRSTDGTTKTANAGEIPDNPLVSATALETMAGNDKASVRVLDLKIGKLSAIPAEQLQPLIDACNEGAGQLPPLPEIPGAGDIPGLGDVLDQLDPATLCGLIEDPAAALIEADVVTVSCEGDTGAFDVIGLKVAGTEVPIPDDVPPNSGTQDTPLDAVLGLTVNKQTKNPDGSFSIKALEIVLADTQTLSFAGATCGEAQAQEEPEDEAGRAPTPPRAEAPEAVRQSVPVTG